MSIIKPLSLSKTSCPACGSKTKYLPGTSKVICSHCGNKSDIPAIDQKSVDELGYFEFLNNSKNSSDHISLQTVKCNNCSSVSSIDTSLKSNHCPYCGDGIVITEARRDSLIKPWGLIPFRIDQKEAGQRFSRWLKKHWFKPPELTRDQDKLAHLKGVYLPYWTFDTSLVVQYYGKYGEEYDDGDRVKLLWFEKTNELTQFFDDISICASNVMNEDVMNALRPWGTEDLIPFEPQYLAGYTTEKYQIDLETAFEKAQDRMTEAIEAMIKQDLGGELQEILAAKTFYDDITFKHILLPVYTASYQIKGKTYQFAINAKTGEIQGKVPKVWYKVVLFVLGILGISALVSVLALSSY